MESNIECQRNLRESIGILNCILRAKNDQSIYYYQLLFITWSQNQSDICKSGKGSNEFQVKSDILQFII